VSSASPQGAAGGLPIRTETGLQERQRQGDLQVRSAADYRALVADAGFEEAYLRTDVVVAANAEFTDQASLVLHLGPSDPPIRVRRFRLGASEAIGGHGNTDLVLPIGQDDPVVRSAWAISGSQVTGAGWIRHSPPFR